jgi:hypothetical protein
MTKKSPLELTSDAITWAIKVKVNEIDKLKAELTGLQRALEITDSNLSHAERRPARAKKEPAK